jgi:hypothetical protein
MVTGGQRLHVVASLAALAVVGLAVSFAIPTGMAASILVPALVLRQGSRGCSFVAAMLYYAPASWAVVPTSLSFLGRDTSLLTSISLWCCAAVLLASPWALLWSRKQNEFWWRIPAGLALGIVPPLGIIGWASPVTAAGLLFPGTGWGGLTAAVVFAGAVAATPRKAFMVAVPCMLVTNAFYSRDPSPPLGWAGIDTNFDHSHDSDSLAAYTRMQSIQALVRASNANVLILPESIVEDWTEATDSFWEETTQFLRGSGRTVLVGATAPAQLLSEPADTPIDFTAELATLRGTGAQPESLVNLGAVPIIAPARPYRNTVIVRGAQFGAFDQRVPVPIGMWKPLTDSGVPLNLLGTGIVHLAGKRAAVLICYEQLIVWPVLTALMHEPDVLIAIANVDWVAATPIPDCQSAAVRFWARLFRLPIVSAKNR